MNVERLINLMLEYQKIHEIKQECITNSQYLYSSLNKSGLNVKVEPVIVIGKRGFNTIIVNHMVVIMYANKDIKILDASYDVIILQDKKYIHNINDFMKNFKDDLSKEGIRYTLSNHINFVNHAKKINSGKTLICDKNHYNNQADYIEKYYYK